MVDLKHIELATDADKAYGIDKWAALFRSISWEEILMTAKNDEYLMEATKTLYNLNADDMVRQRCQARMDAELQEQYLLKKIDTLTAENAAKDAEIESLKRNLPVCSRMYNHNLTLKGAGTFHSDSFLIPFYYVKSYFAFGANFFLSTYHRAPAIHTEE